MKECGHENYVPADLCLDCGSTYDGKVWRLHRAASPTPQPETPWGYGCPLHPGDPQAMSGTPGRCLARPASGGKGRYELASQMCGERLVALVAAAPQRPEPVAWLCPSCGFLSLNDASGYESCSYARVEGHIMEPLFTSPPAASREAVAHCPGIRASAAPVQADVAGWLRDRMPSGQQVGKFGHEPGWTKGYVMGLNDAADDWERTHPPASWEPCPECNAAPYRSHHETCRWYPLYLRTCSSCKGNLLTADGRSWCPVCHPPAPEECDKCGFYHSMGHSERIWNEATSQWEYPAGPTLDGVERECGACGGTGQVRPYGGTPESCLACGGSGKLRDGGEEGR